LCDPKFSHFGTILTFDGQTIRHKATAYTELAKHHVGKNKLIRLQKENLENLADKGHQYKTCKTLKLKCCV